MPNHSKDGLHYFQPHWIEPTAETLDVEVCIYGGTAAGVIAAVQATQLGHSVVLLQPGHTLGGMTTGGLGLTDFGKQGVIGGLSRQFYRDLGTFYGRDEEWLFEPHAAQSVMDGYIEKFQIPVRYQQFLHAVEMDGQRIQTVTMLGGLKVRAKLFMDCTYEGDLLAHAGVSFHVGREANRVYGETINGVQLRDKHQFSHAVDPYVEAGNPQSGVLPDIIERDAAPDGSGDGKIQAYNFRVCMTDDPDLKNQWQKSVGFRELDYELARRWFNAEKDNYNDQLPNYANHPAGVPKKFDVLTQRTARGFYKTDTNNHGAVSSDYIGSNYGWPEASYAQREAIFQDHVRWQQGLYWLLANDSSIPARYRDVYRRFGLLRDEFDKTEHWPHQLYVREARRMVADYVVTEGDTQHHRRCDDSVGMGSYAMDSHNCQRIVRAGRVFNEGDVQLAPAGPYAISYRAIVPRSGECENLLVPVCLSSSHIAFGSIRMEPVFMILGQSAALAAHIALENGCAVQNVVYNELRPLLDNARQVIQAP